jgi:hypothetical protein
MIKRLPVLAGAIVFATSLLGAAPTAKGQTALGLPPAWKVDVTGAASTKAAGRSDFVEYIYIDSSSFTGDQICRLGMVQSALSVTPAATAGTYNVSCTMSSTTQGNATFSGTVSNTLMSGTVTWTLPSGKVYTYNYSGVPFTPAVDPES